MPSGQLGQVLRHLRRLIGGKPLEELADGPLLEQFLVRHDAAAFEALVQRFGPLVLGVCRRVLQDEHDAEDAFQATFLVFAKRAGKIRNTGAVGSWLCGAAYRIALKARAAKARRRAQEKKAGTELNMDRPTDADWNELKPVLDEELNRLPEKYRIPLVLCYLEGKTNEDAARELGWAPGSMSYRLARAKERLRERLVRRGVVITSGLLGPALAMHAKAALPPALVEPTVQGALLFEAGQAVAGIISAPAVALAEGMLQAAHMLKVIIAALVGMFLVVLVGGVGWLLYEPDSGPQFVEASNAIKPLDDRDRIAVRFSDEIQRFGISIPGSKDPRDPKKRKLLTRSDLGNTNNTRVDIEGQKYVWGRESAGAGARWAKSKGKLMKEIRDKGQRRWTSIMDYETERIRVTQTVEIVVGEQTRLYDTALVKYTIENLDTRPHLVGLRALLDTYIGGNDGVPFLVPPSEQSPAYLVDTKETFTKDKVPVFVRALESNNFGDRTGTVAELGLRLNGLEVPEKVAICRWPQEYGAGEADWEWPLQDMNGDSCVVMYWARQPMASGEKRVMGYTYGLGRIADGDTEYEPMRLFAGGSSRVGRAFTLTAYIKGAKPGEKVSVQLPPELTLLAGQSLEQTIEAPANKEYAQVSWRVKAQRVGKINVLAFHARRSVSLEVHIRESSIFD